MKMTYGAAWLTLGLLPALAFAQAKPPRQMEKLNRGVVALHPAENKNYISWRLLADDPDNVAFNVYRQSGNAAAVKLNREPLRDVTFFEENNPPAGSANSYFVRAVHGTQEQPPSAPWLLPAQAPVRQYIPIPIQDLPAGYTLNDCSVGDLDGDGQYEIIVHLTGRARDNSQSGVTDPPIFHAYKLDGTKLWSINLGRNIREGAHYTQFMVYDLDGDGRAEMVCKTADGTTDASGKVIGNKDANWVNSNGYILEGPEFLTVFDGKSGNALYTTDYTPPRGNVQAWGDNYGNRLDRFLACVAYLDGAKPSVVMCRGYYTRTVLAAYDWDGKALKPRWVFDTDDPARPEQRQWRGQGNHNLSVADVDADGKDEIVYGAMCIDDNGRGLWNTRLGHGDALHVSDLDPDRPGLELFDIQERFSDAGHHFNDARTGETLWKHPSTAAGADGEGPGRGVAADIDPRHPGAEAWSKGANITGLYSVKGEKIADREPGSCNFIVQWDGDTLYELLDGNSVRKWNPETSREMVIFQESSASSNNGTKSTPGLSGDILGDWREEIIWRSTNNQMLGIFCTIIPTDRRMVTLMHDPQYRLSIAWQNVGYNQPPHTSFFMGHGMKTPPKPNIKLVELKR
jgi:rhamnogalacturonan endolyase